MRSLLGRVRRDSQTTAALHAGAAQARVVVAAVLEAEEGSDARIAHVFIQPSVGANVTWLLVKFNEVWGVPLGAAASSARRQWRHVFAC